MKLVVLENYVLHQGDLDWSTAGAMVDELVCYERTTQEQVVERIGDAELVVLNKCAMTRRELSQCPNLKWVGILATGTDQLDLQACREYGVSVANVPGYSTNSVAQLAFSMLLAVCQCVERENTAVQEGYWQVNVPERYRLLPQVELCGKTFGIFGYGAIGRQAARLANAFGMRVLVHTRTVRPEYQNDAVEFVSFEQLLQQSDVLSLHCPATAQTVGVMDANALSQMKRGAILLNTARGALVEERAVVEACRSGTLRFYVADSVAVEPIKSDNPLLGVDNIMLTPHVGWATGESILRLMEIVNQNISSFLAGEGQNIVNL